VKIKWLLFLGCGEPVAGCKPKDALQKLYFSFSIVGRPAGITACLKAYRVQPFFLAN
jgi:hypothetical protein